MDERQLKYLATGIAAFIGLYWLYKIKKTKSSGAVGKVAEIMIHPLTSCRGKSVKTAMATDSGLASGELMDRFFAVRIEQSNEKLGAVQFPKLLLIEVEMGGTMTSYIFKAPDMTPLIIDISTLSQKAKHVMYGKDVDCIDGGDAAADWISKYLGKRIRISVQPSGRDVYEHNPDFDRVNWRLGGIKNYKKLVNFSHHYPFNILGVDSVRQINEKIPGKSFTHRYFRTNMLVKALNDNPWDEDNWTGELHIGEAIFAVAAQSSRCTITTMDPATGIKDPDNEPIRTLLSYRLPSSKDQKVIHEKNKKKPSVGMDLVLIRSGRISVGDDIILFPN